MRKKRSPKPPPETRDPKGSDQEASGNTVSDGASHALPPRLLGLWRIPFYYGWIIVAVVFVAEFMASGVGTFVVPLFFEPMSRDMGWSLTLMTGAVTAQTVAYAGISPVLGLALDHFGARPVMLFGAVVAGVGLLLLTQIQEIWHFWLLYATVGALGLHEMGGFTGPVLVTKWFIRIRGRAMALATIGTTAGGMVMAPVIGFLIASVGWRHAWRFMGISVLIVVVPLVWLFIRRQPEDMGLLPDGDSPGGLPSEESQAGEPQGTRSEESWTVKEAMRTRTLWLLIVAMNLVQLSATSIVIHLVPFLMLQEGLSAQTASLVVTARLAAASLSRIVWGFATDRYPIRYCLAAGFISRALNPLTLVLLPFPLNIAGVVLTSITGGGFQVLQPMAFANYFGRRHSGAILGSVRPFTIISSLVGPLFVALVYDITGTFDLAFLVAGAMAVLSAGIALLASPPRKRGDVPTQETPTATSGTQ